MLNLKLDPDACKTPVNMDPGKTPLNSDLDRGMTPVNLNTGGDIHLVHMDSE